MQRDKIEEDFVREAVLEDEEEEKDGNITSKKDKPYKIDLIEDSL